MNKLKFKSILLILIAFMLFLTGCKVDKTFTIDKYELQNDIYVQNIHNDEIEVDLSDGININDTSNIKFYKDVDHSVEIEDPIVTLEEGNNFYYAVITFKDKSTEDLKLNLYRLKMFTVKFETNCKIKIRDQKVEENSKIEKPTTKLVKYGYGFKGWDYNFHRPVTKDLVVTARWEPNTYTITYNANGGDLNTTETYITYGESYVLETPTKEGYDFVGWFYDGKKIDSEKWDLEGDITIEAVWEEETITYEIEYIIVGCIGSHLQRTYTNKEEVILRVPYKSGYRFRGWYFEGDFSGDRIYTLPKGTTGNLTLYSKWEWFDITKANISFLGDSISTFYKEDSKVNSMYHGKDEYYYPIYSKDVKTVEDTWWFKVLDQTKANLLVNDSLSGSSCYNNGSEECTPQATMNNKRINNIKNSDIVIINIGTNDNVNGHTYLQFEQSYITMINRIKEVCPDVFIFTCNLGYTDYNDYFYTEERRVEFNKIIKKVSEDNDCFLIDFASIQTKDTYKTFLDGGLHPNKNGMQQLGNLAVSVLANYLF